MTDVNKIVLHIPHASVNGIFGAYGKWPSDPYFINDCVNRWTDWYTDFLFATSNENVTSVVFPYSRFVCDAERLDNDPMEAEGQGILYRQFSGFKRGMLTMQESDFLYLQRKQHLDAVRSQLTPDSLLIDCHSFPSDLYDCDICIGHNSDDTYDEHLVNLVKRQFEKSNYKVAVNKPYSNSLLPETGFIYKSLMIEVNKRVYMTRIGTLNPSSRQWKRWFGCINSIYNTILADKE